MKEQIKQLPVGYLNKKKGIRKKTTHCSPREIVGRIIEILNKDGAHDNEAVPAIRELINEWIHS